MELIHIKDVTKEYKNGVTAVYDLNLRIKKGDFAFIIGGSGSGKSTVIKMLYREEKPTRGEIVVGGLNVAKLRNGKVYINGSDQPLDDSFVPETPTGNYGPYKVPENCYFMLGDNRENSRDSRFWDNTYVTFDEIVGKAVIRYFPSIKLLD